MKQMECVFILSLQLNSTNTPWNVVEPLTLVLWFLTGWEVEWRMKEVEWGMNAPPTKCYSRCVVSCSFCSLFIHFNVTGMRNEWSESENEWKGTKDTTTQSHHESCVSLSFFFHSAHSIANKEEERRNAQLIHHSFFTPLFSSFLLCFNLIQFFFIELN